MNGITYCTTFTANYERVLPNGFIVSRHYKSAGSGSSKYVQVAGRFDRDKFLLKSDDEGAGSESGIPQVPSVRVTHTFSNSSSLLKRSTACVAAPEGLPQH